MKIKSIISLILIIILFSTAAGFGFYYLNLPIAKVSKQHIKDMSLTYKRIKAQLEKPYNVGKKNLGKYNLGILEIINKRIKSISKTIVIKFINKEDIKKSLIQGKNYYYVLFGDTVTNDVFKNILVTINVLDEEDGPDDVEINDNEETDIDNEEQCDEDEEECNFDENDFLELEDLKELFENEGIDASDLNQGDSISKAYNLIKTEVLKHNEYITINLSDNNEKFLRYTDNNNIVNCEFSESEDLENENIRTVKVKLNDVGKPKDIKDYERMMNLDKFLTTHNAIDASSISEEDDPCFIIKLIESFLNDNGQTENYDQIEWYQDEDDEDVPEITAGDCDVNIYFIIGEETSESYNITLNDVKFFKTAEQTVKQILELFEKPLTSVALNTIITEEFLLDYINDQIKIINKDYSAKLPYQIDKSKTLTKGKNYYRIQIYKDDEKINFKNYIFMEDEENKNSFENDDEIIATVEIIDANEIKNALKQIAINIKNQPINKYELQNFISSENNTNKIEKLKSYIMNHVNKVAKNTSNIKMNLKVIDFQIDDPTSIDKNIETNLMNVRKSIIPSELLKPQDKTKQANTWKNFETEFKTNFDLNILNLKPNINENKLKQLLEQGVKLPLLKEGSSYLTAVTYLNIWIKTQGFNGIILEFDNNMQYVQTIILGQNSLALKYKINTTENKVIANVICETAKSEKNKNNEKNDENQKTDLNKIIEQFEEGIDTNTLSIKDNMTKAIIFFQHEANKINKKAKVSFQNEPKADEKIGEDRKNTKIKTFKLTVKLKQHSKNTNHAKISKLQEEATNDEDRFEQIEAELRKGIDSKYNNDEHFTTKMHQKDVLQELEKIVHHIDSQASIQIENSTNLNSALTEGHMSMETVVRLGKLKKKVMVKISKIQAEKLDTKEELKHIKQHLEKKQLDGSNLIAFQKFSDAYNILTNEISTLNNQVKFKIIEENKILKEGQNLIKIELTLDNEKESVLIAIKNVKENQENDADLIQKIKNKMNNYLKTKKITENDSISSIIDKLLHEANLEVKDTDKEVKVKSTNLPKKLDASTNPIIHFYLQTKHKQYDFTVKLPKIQPDPVKKNKQDEKQREKEKSKNDNKNNNHTNSKNKHDSKNKKPKPSKHRK